MIGGHVRQLVRRLITVRTARHHQADSSGGFCAQRSGPNTS